MLSIYLIFANCLCIVNISDISNRRLGLFLMLSKGEIYDTRIQGKLSMKKNALSQVLSS